jgi:hypothetical protein
MRSCAMRHSIPLFFLPAGQNMSQSTPLWSGMALGGTLLTTLSAGSTVVLEKQTPTIKSIARDFIIGAVIIAVLFQLLPDSTTNLVNMLFSFLPMSASLALPKLTGGGEDMEVQVGVPRF